MNCFNCGLATKNPRFCSRTCSTSYNNKSYPKRKWKCKRCKAEKEKPSKHARCCADCKIARTRFGKDFLLGEVREAYKNKKYGQMNVHTLIRVRARDLYKQYKSCWNCGYNKHVEVAHIIRLADASDALRISDVNNIENILILCPNCHWEFDHGQLALEQIKISSRRK